MVSGLLSLLRSERRSSSYFLHRKYPGSLDRVRLQLDHSASRAGNHNTLRHLTFDFIMTRSAREKPNFRNFVVSGNGMIANNCGCKSAAMTLCWYVQTCSRKSHIVKFRTKMSYSQWEAANELFTERENICLSNHKLQTTIVLLLWIRTINVSVCM